MFKFNIKSKSLAEVMKKISIAIPAGKQSADNGGIKLVCYKKLPNQDKSLGIMLAFNGSIQSASPMEIEDVISEDDELRVHINGKKILATAMAYAALDTILEVTIDKEMVISNVGNKVTLPLGQETQALRPDEEMLQEIEMETVDFVSFINFASSCCGEMKNARGMHCIGLRIDEEARKIYGVSSNATRCAFAEMNDIKIKKTPTQGDNAPMTTVIEGELLKNAVKTLNGDRVTVSISKKSLRIKCGAHVIIILTQETPFPFDAVMQVKASFESKGSWKAPLAKVFQALAIYEITMEGLGIEMEMSGESQVCFHGKNDQTNASVPCATKGDIPKITLNEKELKAALSVFAKDQDIIIEAMNDSMPVLVRQNMEDSNQILIMPVNE